METAILAGGCFWCLEAVFAAVPGVKAVQSGYTGGQLPQPTYEQVSSGSSGHAEAVSITFDPALVSYRQLLELFFQNHDPTTLNRQGADHGTQYRSAIFYLTDEQRQTAEAVKGQLATSGAWTEPIVTLIEVASEFYPAEDYHQNYYQRNPNSPYSLAVIKPKIVKIAQPRSKR